MIQRIQTLWLLVASTLAFISFSVPFCTGYKLVENVKTHIRLTAQENFLLLILTVAILLGLLVAIFLYKERKLQIRIVSAAMVVSVLNLGIYYWQSTKLLPEDKTFAITALASIAIPFFLFLSIKGIYRDNKLVKNLDRLR